MSNSNAGTLTQTEDIVETDPQQQGSSSSSNGASAKGRSKEKLDYDRSNISDEHQEVIDQLFDASNVHGDSPLTTRLTTMRELKLPTMVLGRPGIGKSDQIRQVVSEDDFYEDIRVSTARPEDTVGIPHIHNDLDSVSTAFQNVMEVIKDRKARGLDTDKHQKVFDRLAQQIMYYASKNKTELRYSRPHWMPPVGHEGPVILNFEEINTGASSVMNTLLQLFGTPPGKKYRVGPHVVGDDVWIVATGNRLEDAAHVNPIPGPLRDRMQFIKYDWQMKTWIPWAMRNGVDTTIISFLRNNSSYAIQDPADDLSPGATPRAWSRKVNMLYKHGVRDRELFTGAVGEGPAHAFMGFLKEMEHMPDIDKLLAGTSDFDWAEADSSIRYSVTLELIQRCVRDRKDIKPAIGIMLKAPSEMTVVFISQLLSHEDRSIAVDLIHNSTIRKWIQDHSNLIQQASVS